MHIFLVFLVETFESLLGPVWTSSHIAPYFIPAEIAKYKLTGILEQRQYKNDSIQSKIIPILNLPRFFTTYAVREKGGNFKIGIIFD